jgi:coproporphyrinogen III oxidase
MIGAKRGSPRFEAFSSFILKKQTEVLSAVETADGSGATFQRDPWERPADGSFGVTTCLEEGALVEKGAASVSVVHGVLTEVAILSLAGPSKRGARLLGTMRWREGYSRWAGAFRLQSLVFAAHAP